MSLHTLSCSHHWARSSQKNLWPHECMAVRPVAIHKKPKKIPMAHFIWQCRHWEGQSSCGRRISCRWRLFICLFSFIGSTLPDAFSCFGSHYQFRPSGFWVYWALVAKLEFYSPLWPRFIFFNSAAICWRQMGPWRHYGRPAGRPCGQWMYIYAANCWY